MAHDWVAEKVETIPEGKYTGKIVEIYRDFTTKDTQTYDYTKYTVELENEKKNTLILSFPSRITVLNDGSGSTQHAKFLIGMGVNVVEGEKLNEKILDLVGTKIGFLVQQKETKSGTFSEIVKDSVKKL